MFMNISLRSRLLILIIILVLINIAGSIGTIAYTYRTQKIYSDILDQNVTAFKAAQMLETELILQKGLVTYFFLTKNAKWLEQLNTHDAEFREWLSIARDVSNIDEARPIINEIESRYIRYVFDRAQVIDLYKKGEQEEGVSRHWAVRNMFFDIHGLTEKFRLAHEKRIQELHKEFNYSARAIELLAWGAIPFVVFISIALLFVINRQILEPIRNLINQNGNEKQTVQITDEVGAIRHRVDELVTSVSIAREKLTESQEHLVQSEKLAMVGKLAAGVAHSVRNPLTSLKMRLFTLESTLRLTPTQREDLSVISEEIRHIDKILRNFLEYARPPKLELHWDTPSDTIDTTLQLLQHRMELNKTSVHLQREERLPEISIDKDQLKEVFVNLLINASEAMNEGGDIYISEKVGTWSHIGEAVLISFRDNGPGIPEEWIEDVFQPFFSSKEEGSGLGLSIAKRIINEHGGEIILRTEKGVGTTFTIVLPLREKQNGQHINS
jgi:signal transduction histidine kinase